MDTAAARNTTQVKVYYEDTDALGVVYYANYLKYLERGRTELIDGAGRSVAEWNRDGFMFAVYKADLTFSAPARLSDVVDVVTEITEQTAFRVVMDQRIELAGKVLVKAIIQLVCLDADLKLREFPKNIA